MQHHQQFVTESIQHVNFSITYCKIIGLYLASQS